VQQPCQTFKINNINNLQVFVVEISGVKRQRQTLPATGVAVARYRAKVKIQDRTGKGLN
jgi:hypothetical protein